MPTLDFGDFAIVIPEQTALGLQATVSRWNALHKVSSLIGAQLTDREPFDEWAEQCLCLDSNASVSAADLQFSYLRFCDLALIEHEDRLTVTAFGRRLRAMGIGRGQGPCGRIVRTGCSLNPDADARIRQELQKGRQIIAAAVKSDA